MNPHGYGRFATTMDDLLPLGAWLVAPIEPIKDFDRSTMGPDGFVQAVDKETGVPLWSTVVQSGDMENAPAWLQRLKVKIVSAARPELPPTMPGTPFRPVWFEGLVVVPYVDDKACKPADHGRSHRCWAKVAFSVRATGLRAPKTSGRPSPAAAQDGAA
jgi:hypothetical protein